MPYSRLVLLAALLVAPASWAQATRHEFKGPSGAYIAERVLTGMSQPVAIDFLPDGRAIVAQRNLGKMTIADFAKSTSVDVENLPTMLISEYAGIHDVELHPDYASNGWIYISYSEGEEFHNTTVLDRVRLDGNRVTNRERLFAANQWSETGVHHAGRIQIRDGYVYMSLGDRRHEAFVQDRTNHIGTIVRLHDDGKVPTDNPFVGMKDKDDKPILPEIWSWGHRNPQGLYFHPETGELWSNEHGPRGGDELNRIVKGANYGWPIIGWGFQYDGGIYGRGISAEEGMEQPLWVWVPSIGPSDLVYYSGDAFPAWKGSWLTGSLAKAHLNRVVVQDEAVVLEERLANGFLGRIRTVGVDRKGYVYLGNDAGEIWRLSPR